VTLTPKSCRQGRSQHRHPATARRYRCAPLDRRLGHRGRVV